MSRPPVSRSAAAKDDLSAEEIFGRFASRILFLTCEESADTSSLASGVLVSDDGFIVTNAHVVSDCRSMKATRITGAMRQSYEPVLKYYDENSDTAVLKIDGLGLDFFDLPSRRTRIGERVYAIGNPRGLEQSISEGIVSGNREVDGVSWIQHSAPISPGSSGGALISARGELLGINSRYRADSQNLNFAVPAATLASALSSARTLSGFMDFPPNARVTGTYAGVVTNFSTAKSASFSIFVRGSTGGAIQGCMVVKLPLMGSGPLRGEADDSKLSFVTTGDFMRIRFDGQRDRNDLRGTYLVSGISNGASDQKGTFVLHKTSSEGPSRGFDILSCSSDVALIRRAAEDGDTSAQLQLGRLYHEGLGVPQDPGLAAAWFVKAAELGNAEAQVTLGALDESRGGTQNYRSAAVWYSKAAEQGSEPAQLRLAFLYAWGLGVPRDAAQAAGWYSKAAAQGNAEAQQALGAACQLGSGVPQDYFLAAAWYRKAAEQGDTVSEYLLGVLNFWGFGTAQSDGEAYFWIKVASAGEVEGRKPEDLAAELNSIAPHVPPRDLAQVQERAREWLISHPGKRRNTTSSLMSLREWLEVHPIKAP